MKILILLLTTFLLQSCSTYKWFDTTDCKEEIGNFKKCLVKE